MIGIFDSGSGGLTVAAAIRSLAPQADILYFGDNANAPYGNKTDAELLTLTLNIVRFLRTNGATTIVSACNSVSASVIRPMLNIEMNDLVEMVGPAVEDLAQRNIKSVAVLATQATCRTGMYAAACAERGITCVEISCPTLAGLIESDACRPQLISAITESLDKIPQETSDVLLACTHYPLVLDIFRRVAGSLTFIDPAHAVAKAAIRQYGADGNGMLVAAYSKRSAAFERFAKEMLGVAPGQIEILSADETITSSRKAIL